MFILLFIVLRHQYLCSAVWTVCSYMSNAWSTTSKCWGVCVCACVCRRGWLLEYVWEESNDIIRIRFPRDAKQKWIQFNFMFYIMDVTMN